MMRRFLRRLQMLSRRGQLERDLDEEIRFHLEMQAAEGGRRADFGNVMLIREAARANWGWPALDDFLRELRYAIRSLSRSPVATLAAVASLGLGIGIAAAVFSIVNAVFLRSLEVPNAGQLVSLYQRADNGRGGFSSYSYPQYEHMRDHNSSFEGLAAFSRIPVNAQIAGSAERLISEFASNNYLQVLGVAPALGRAFAAEDGNVAIVGDRLWRDRFGGDRQVLGRKIILNGQPFTIIGVLPPSFRGVVLDWGKAPSLWVPASSHGALRDLPMANPGSHWMLVTGRLKPGAGIGQAQSEAEALSASFYEMHPMKSGSYRAVVLPTQQARFWPGLRNSVSNYLSVLGAVAALTFLMACFNVANLLLGRAEKRKREMGIQVAIGAGRVRLARSLLLEALLLAGAGAIAGLGVASLAPAVLERFENPLGVPLALDLSLDLQALGFIIGAAFLATVLVGVSPARLAWRIDVMNLIKGETASGRGGRFRPADALVVAQVAICLIALAGASLFVRTLQHAQASDPMFRAEVPFWQAWTSCREGMTSRGARSSCASCLRA
jgi:predicted permease